jgi:hypothetical protein
VRCVNPDARCDAPFHDFFDVIFIYTYSIEKLKSIFVFHFVTCIFIHYTYFVILQTHFNMASMGFDSETIRTIMNLADDNVHSMKESDYLQVCNLLKYVNDRFQPTPAPPTPAPPTPTPAPPTPTPFTSSLPDTAARNLLNSFNIVATPTPSPSSSPSPSPSPSTSIPNTNDFTNIPDEQQLQALRIAREEITITLTRAQTQLNLLSPNARVTNKHKQLVIETILPRTISLGPRGQHIKMSTSQINQYINVMLEHNIIPSRDRFDFLARGERNREYVNKTLSLRRDIQQYTLIVQNYTAQILLLGGLR